MTKESKLADIKEAILQFEYFNKWNEEEIEECCKLSKIVDYKQFDIVYGHLNHCRNYVYFVLNGQCQLIEPLYVEMKYSRGKCIYKLRNTALNGKSSSKKHHKDDDVDYNLFQSLSRKCSMQNAISTNKRLSYNEVLSNRLLETFPKKNKRYSCIELPNKDPLKINLQKLNTQTIFMQVCLLDKLSLFGLGEDIENRQVVALTNVTCLLVPKHWLLLKNKENIWQRTIHYLNSHIPSTEDVFKRFKVNRTSAAFGRGLLKYPIRKNLTNSINNIPYSIKCKISEYSIK